ncbi:MAG: PEP-CTERM sorting domain-containing protein [Rivularia sp. (in: cyanobacteria)]
MKNAIFKGLLSIGVLAAGLSSGSAQAAGLIGDTVNAQLGATGSSPFLNQNAEVTEPGVEFTAVGAQNATISLDVKDNSFDIIYNLTTLSGVGFPSTWSLSDLDFGNLGFITDVTLASGNSSLINNISFTEDSVQVDLADIVTSRDGSVNTWSFDIATSNSTQSVPEPTTILGTAAALSLGILKKKKGAKLATTEAE